MTIIGIQALRGMPFGGNSITLIPSNGEAKREGGALGEVLFSTMFRPENHRWHKQLSFVKEDYEHKARAVVRAFVEGLNE